MKYQELHRELVFNIVFYHKSRLLSAASLYLLGNLPIHVFCIHKGPLTPTS